MNNYEKGKICLDKSIELSRKIINGDEEINPYIHINRELGEAKTFNIGNSSIEIAIEHIGLAELAYRKAVSSFYSTKIAGDGNEEKIFEELEPNDYISNFIDNCTTDTLAWYKKGSENFKFDYHNTNKVYRQDFTNYNKEFSIANHFCDERAIVLSSTMDCAMQEYLKIAKENGIDIDKQDLWFKEIANYSNKISNLQHDTEDNFSQIFQNNIEYPAQEQCQ